MNGQTISHYCVAEKLGGGGMGVVYAAQDTRLNRSVALKFLPNDVARDPQAIARFRREAEAASSLNHPNICTIYDIGDQDGQYFIAMELLRGNTLQTMISGLPLPLDRLLHLALQIADALEAAHKNGIVHRDLKPSNIFVTSGGVAKVLDFGLAKRLRLDSAATDDAATVSRSLTIRGQIVGTIAYMSPEQVQDKDVDARSDIFSLGAVLFEMATGQRAFAGESTAAVIAEILRGNSKPVTVLNRKLPDELQRIISKALEKDRDDRYQSINDLMIDLRRINRESSQAWVRSQTPPLGFAWPRRRLVWASGVVALALLLLLAFSTSVMSPVPVSFTSEQITFSPELKDGPIVTDGSRLYFQVQGHPVEMSVKGGPLAPLRPSLSGMNILDISPDGSQMLALNPDANDETGRGSIWSVPVLGGYPRIVRSQLARDAHWSADGRSIVYVDLNSVYVSSQDGANPRKIWDAPGRVDAPYFSPDSSHIRVTLIGDNIGLGNQESRSARLWELDADGGNPHRLELDWPEKANQQYGQWTPDGKHFVFMSSREGINNLYDVIKPPWFNSWKKPTAVRLTGGQVDELSATPSRDSSGFFIIGRIAQGAMRVYESKTKRFVPFLNELAASAFVISPDKKWMVYTDYPRHYLWRSRLDGSEKLQLTDIYAAMPQWSPDSKKIVFSDWHQLYLVSLDGGSPERLVPEASNEVAPTWWPDGKSVAFNDFPLPGHRLQIKVLNLSSRKISIMPGSEGFYLPSWSPDGKNLVAMAQNPPRMVLYSAESGTWKDLKQFDAPWGYWVWSRDSKAIYMAMTVAEPGIYRLTITDGAWNQIAKFSGLTLSNEGTEVFPSLTSDGQIAMMNDTSVVQIYSGKWNKDSELH